MSRSGDGNKLLKEQSDLPEGPSTRPVPSSRSSLTVRFSNPEDPTSEREVADITIDNLLVRETDLSNTTDNFLAQVTDELRELDRSIENVVAKTNLLITENSDHTELQKSGIIGRPLSVEELRNLEQKKLEESYLENKINWNKDQLPDHSNTMADNTDPMQQIQSGETETTTLNITKDQLTQIINKKIQEALQSRNTPRLTESLSEDEVGLKDAIRMLPKPFDGENMELLEVFIEKCEFAVECTVPTAIPRLVKAIRHRLIGWARQVTKYKIFETWEELRDLLKTS